jgi:hypothetical protein
MKVLKAFDVIRPDVLADSLEIFKKCCDCFDTTDRDLLITPVAGGYERPAGFMLTLQGTPPRGHIYFSQYENLSYVMFYRSKSLNKLGREVVQDIISSCELSLNKRLDAQEIVDVIINTSDSICITAKPKFSRYMVGLIDPSTENELAAKICAFGFTDNKGVMKYAQSIQIPYSELKLMTIPKWCTHVIELVK